MLHELTQRGISAVCLNGSMSMEERAAVQGSSPVMHGFGVNGSGGEGLNLQFCHVVVNYDIPEPHAPGAAHRACGLHRQLSVRASTWSWRYGRAPGARVLEEKLAVILDELGLTRQAMC